MNIKKTILVLVVVFWLGFGLLAQELKVETLAKTTKSWDGSTIPPYLSGQPEMTILKLTVPPKGTVDWHNHPVVLMGYLLKGEFTVENAEGKTVILKEGDTIVEVVNKLHRGVNRGKYPVEIVVFYAGNVGVPNSIGNYTKSKQHLLEINKEDKKGFFGSAVSGVRRFLFGGASEVKTSKEKEMVDELELQKIFDLINTVATTDTKPENKDKKLTKKEMEALIDAILDGE